MWGPTVKNTTETQQMYSKFTCHYFILAVDPVLRPDYG